MKKTIKLILLAFIFLITIAGCKNGGDSNAAVNKMDSTAAPAPAATEVKDTSINQNYAFDTTVLTSFRQGHNYDYNCASIAVIKCAIATFGADSVFKKITENNNNYTVILRNGDTVILTNEEKILAQAKSGFLVKSNKEIFEKAQFIYAVLAKSATLDAKGNPRSEFSKDYAKTLDILHDGATTTNLPVLLGLNMDYFKWKHRQGVNAYVFANGFHAVYGCKGMYDDYGTVTALTKFNFRDHMTLNVFKDLETHLFTLKDIN